MNKKFSILIVLLGLSLVIYGYLKAPISNETEIRTTYRCDRITKEALSTDKYCTDLSTAPIARKQLANVYIYSGILVTLAGGTYFAINSRQKNS